MHELWLHCFQTALRLSHTYTHSKAQRHWTKRRRILPLNSSEGHWKCKTTSITRHNMGSYQSTISRKGYSSGFMVVWLFEKNWASCSDARLVCRICTGSSWKKTWIRPQRISLAKGSMKWREQPNELVPTKFRRIEYVPFLLRNVGHERPFNRARAHASMVFTLIALCSVTEE